MKHQHENIEENASTYLLLIGAKVSSSYVKKRIIEHPDYPTLLSVVDTYESLGIRPIAKQIDSSEFEQLEFPYLAHLHQFGGTLALIKDSSDLEANASKLSGIVLQAEQISRISHKENTESLLLDRTKLIAISLLCLSLFIIVTSSLALSFSWQNSVAIVTTFCGLVVAYLLVAKEFGIKYRLVEEFCSSRDESGCDKVLNSAGANIYALVKLSDVVACYFIFQAILTISGMIFNAYAMNINSALVLLSTLCLPVILLSLFYQYFVIKAWCKLCLVVNAILSIQAFIFLYNNHEISSRQLIISCLIIIGGLAMVSGFFLAVKSIILERNKLMESEIRAVRVKHRASVFAHLLNTNSGTTGVAPNQGIIIGSATAPIVITMVSNLYCNPCKDKYAQVVELANSLPDKVRIEFIFVPSGPEGLYPTPLQYLINYWMDNIKGSEDESGRTEIMLKEWYSSMDYEDFKSVHHLGSTNNTKKSEELALAHSEWVRANKVGQTPTLFINEAKVPDSYNLNDIHNMVPSLIGYLSRVEINQAAKRQVSHQQ